MKKFEAADYVDWDWLPGAAAEIEVYLARLLTEASITAHAVDARSKSIASFQEKCALKEYDNPRQQVTDTVAIRLITYSVTDQERAVELGRSRFVVKEDMNPGADKPPARRGYDCAHLVVTGELQDRSRDWLVAGGHLARYFDRFGGLEIQIRTVASHAWAEFEHSRRYKGVGYRKVSEHDRETIDQLFGAAADARSALDETFTAIDRVLANPSRAASLEESVDEVPTGEDGPAESELSCASESEGQLDAALMKNFLARRFPNDNEGSEAGVEFACELVRACGLSSIQETASALSSIDSTEVRNLMSTTIAVTRVRRLDDELLAVFGEDYIRNTESIGTVSRRGDQLRWRFDRLRGKVTVKRSPVAFQILGDDCPDAVRVLKLPAARAVRELAGIVANRGGAQSIVMSGAISTDDDLPMSTRARPVRLEDGTNLWVATNLNRAASEALMSSIVDSAPALDLRVLRAGEPFLP